MKYPRELWGPVIEARVRELVAQGLLRQTIVARVCREIQRGELRPGGGR